MSHDVAVKYAHIFYSKGISNEVVFNPHHGFKIHDVIPLKWIGCFMRPGTEFFFHAYSSKAMGRTCQFNEKQFVSKQILIRQTVHFFLDWATCKNKTFLTCTHMWSIYIYICIYILYYCLFFVLLSCRNLNIFRLSKEEI